MSVKDDILLRNQVIPFAWHINYLANFYSLKANGEIRNTLNMSRQEFVILFCLSNSRNVTANDICNVTGRPKNTISRAISLLLDKGYVERQPNPEDGRSWYLHISETGKEMYEKLIQCFKKWEEQMLTGLDPSERALIAELLLKLVANFNPWVAKDRQRL